MEMKVTVVFLARAGDIVDPSNRVVELELPEGSILRDLFREISKTVSRRLGDGVLSGRLVFKIWVDGVETANFLMRLRDGSRVTISTPEMGG